MNVALLSALSKVVIAGEQAGFTLPELIQLLNKGISVETILELIDLRLEERRLGTSSASRWIM